MADKYPYEIAGKALKDEKFLATRDPALKYVFAGGLLDGEALWECLLCGSLLRSTATERHTAFDMSLRRQV